MRLKTAREILIAIKKENSGLISMFEFGKIFKRILKNIEKTIAINILDKGPAREIIAISFLGCCRLYGSTGTGLAQPKRKGNLKMNKVRGIIMVPRISIWGIGFRVRRPMSLAVGSPRRSAIRPCITS